MLGVFSSSVVSPPDELVAAGCRTPSPKTTASKLVGRFADASSSAVCVHVGDHVQLAYTHQNESLLNPRTFAVKDEVFCLFEGALDNLGSLRQQYGLAKSANEAILLIEAYKALRDRAPYPPNHVVGHLSGNFAFIVFDKTTSTLFVASDQYGKVPLYWGITADGYVAFADDADLLKGSCACFLPSRLFLLDSRGTEMLQEPEEQDHRRACRGRGDVGRHLQGGRPSSCCSHRVEITCSVL